METYQPDSQTRNFMPPALNKFLAAPVGIFILFLAACATPPPVNLSEEGIFAERPPDAIQGDGSADFFRAREFDKLARGKLDNSAWKEMKAECKQTPHLFCPSILRYRALQKLVAEKSRVRHPAPQKAITPLSPIFSAKGVSNLTALRKAEVDSLLKGFASLTPAQLVQVGKAALASPKCPNNAVIATAATLEDFLPEAANWELIARLYAQGGACAKKAPVDREHFYTRASLFFHVAGRTADAFKIISKVNPTDAFAGRTAYWRARFAETLGKNAEANSARQRLQRQQPFSFHAAMLSKQQGLDHGANFLVPGKIERVPSKKFSALNGLIAQAELLKKYGFDFSAAALVDWAMERFSRMESKTRLYLVALGDPPAKVAQVPFILLSGNVPRSRPALELMFPKPFFELFVRSAGNLNPYLLMAVARKESRFNPMAVSPANAQGMMQIAVDTAQKMLGGTNFNLFDPTTSVELAERHLSRDLAHFGGNLPQAIAAYNAGEDAVAEWLKRYPTNDPVLWIDLIPYRETRDYTGLVLSYYYWYRRLYDSNAVEALP